MGRANVTRAGCAAAFTIAVLAPVISMPAVARAADDRALQVLPDDALVAVVADLDEDRGNELVRIVASEGARHTVEAWKLNGEAWEVLGALPVPGADLTTPDHPLASRAEASSLLIWRSAGRERVLVIARSGWRTTDPDGEPCCIDLYELVADAGELALLPVPLDGDLGDFFQAADMDADGTDELIRVRSNLRGDESTLEVLRWDGEAFRQLISLPGAGPIWGVMVGDSDGVAGSDVLIGPAPTGDLQRIAWVDGEPVVDAAHLDLGERSEGGSIAAIADRALVLALPQELRTLRWPRGAEPATVARLDGLIYPYPSTIGDGSGTLLAVQEVSFTGNPAIAPLALYDLGLRRVGTVRPRLAAMDLAGVVQTQSASPRGLERYIYPYLGPMPGARGGDPLGYVWGGIEITAGRGGGFERRPISLLAGLQPLGLAGPDDAWMVLGSGYLYYGRVAYLFEVEVPEGFGTITLAPADVIDGAAPANATVTLRNAVDIGQGVDGETELMAEADSFDVVIDAPIGSLVTVWDGRGAEELMVTGPAMTITIEAPRRPEDEDRPIRASLFVVTPDGRADVFKWTGTYVRQPPTLSVAGRTDALSLSATLEGTVGPLTAVFVDGRAVPVTPDGTFAATIDAHLWPHHAVVTARNPLGHQTAARVEVVGVYDYRGLPWVAIVGAATVGAGAVLFVRGPRDRHGRPQPVGDGRLEELDAIEGVQLDGR